MGEPLLSGRVALVTGGASGNGRAIALALAAHGARAVVIADVRHEPREGGAPTHELIHATTGAESVFVECDVREPDSVERAVAAADAYGGLDIMVNNAGVVGPAHQVTDFSTSDFQTVIDINLRGCFLGARSAAARMVERGSGTIVNVSSVAGLLGSRSSAVYSASKAGIHLLTSSMARELGPRGVRVNCIMPGIVDTYMTSRDRRLASPESAAQVASGIPLQRLGKPEDIGNAVVLLASDLASYVTGASLVVDGGYISCLP